MRSHFWFLCTFLTDLRDMPMVDSWNYIQDSRDSASIQCNYAICQGIFCCFTDFTAHSPLTQRSLSKDKWITTIFSPFWKLFAIAALKIRWKCLNSAKSLMNEHVERKKVKRIYKICSKKIYKRHFIDKHLKKKLKRKREKKNGRSFKLDFRAETGMVNIRIVIILQENS